MTNHTALDTWFVPARYGLFIHYGLYSLLGRGEWAMNREAIPPAEYAKLADRFTAEDFDADALCQLAQRGGMRYLVFTTMHHDGFRLYDTQLSDYSSVKTAAKRDLTAEIIAAARRHGLRIGLYHSLNNWFDQPDSVAALESPAAYQTFIDATFARIEELVRRYNPIDMLWYDGWWPFHADRWQAERMNAMVRTIQPHILFNGRNALPGDFATPEQHLSAPVPWRPWEACVTTNQSWGYHPGDRRWKSPAEVIDLLTGVANGRGNLLLNVGPTGSGQVPPPARELIETVGRWIETNDGCIYDTDRWSFDPEQIGPRPASDPAGHRADWYGHGASLVRGNSLYLLLHRWPGKALSFAGLEARVQSARLLDPALELAFRQEAPRLSITGLPESAPGDGRTYPVLRLDCDRPPTLYWTGGMRIPNVPHPHYDPCPSDLAGHNPG